jgi:CheY-like chemotaxis protein
LDISKIESGKLDMVAQEVPLSSVLESSTILVQPLALNGGVTIECNWQDAPFIVADPMRIKQVMVNLLSNSVKYNKRGGCVTVTYTEDSQNKRVRINVSDTGIGIREEDQKRIFEPFERIVVRGEHIEGTGIGLTITKVLVESMDGIIGFTSQFGKGSDFWIELPKADQETLPSKRVAASNTKSASGEKAGERPKVVLYIEDNPTNQIVMQKMMNRIMHCKLYIAPDAEEGIMLAGEKQPDLILMDIELPGASGYEALETLKGNPLTKHIPIIAVTAHAMLEDVTKGKQSKFVDYIVKPIDMDLLKTTIANVLQA